MNRPRDDVSGRLDFDAQIKAFGSPAAENNFWIGSGTDIRLQLIDAADRFNPGTTGKLYNGLAVGFGTNSNNYVAYLLQQIGFMGELNISSGLAPGINDPIVNAKGPRTCDTKLKHYGEFTIFSEPYPSPVYYPLG